MVTKKIIKNWLGKNLTKSYFLTGKTHEGCYNCFSLFSFLKPILIKTNKDKFMSHLEFKNLHAMIQWSWYWKLQPNFCVMETARKDWKRIYKSNTNLQLMLQHMVNLKLCLLEVLKSFQKNWKYWSTKYYN